MKFLIRSKDFEPCYLRLKEEGKLKEKVEKALSLLEKPCRVCPRRCKVKRLDNEKGVCKIGRYAVVSSAFAHFGEEDVLRGVNGSGTIFFSGCNLKCVFCQNWDISQNVRGYEVKPKELAKIMIYLQEQGCHNINFVTPEHVVSQIMEAIPFAIEMGLNVPIVYNTSSYDSEESLELMEGIVDIYMPDFKFWEKESARKYSLAPDYPEVARRSIKTMHKQVGDLVLDEYGIAKRGILLRHLVMPNLVEESKKILKWIRDEISENTFINIMAQYRPEYKAKNYPEISRRPKLREFWEVVEYAREIGLKRLDKRSIENGKYFLNL
ncbi:MAG: radical SAM protein [Candidatus Hydrothermales bacterium]